MFEFLDTTVLLSVGAALGVAFLVSQAGRKKYKLPPYPWFCVPVIGNVFSLLFCKEKAFVLFYKTSKKPEYKKVFMIKVGARNICLLNHIDVVKEALMTKQTDFANRPNLFSADIATQGKDIVFTQYSPEWRYHRKIAHKAIREFASGKALEKIIYESVQLTISTLEEKDLSKPFTIKPYLELLVVNMFLGICFGRIYDFDDPEFQQFTGLTKDFLDSFGTGMPADVFPWLSVLPFQGRGMKKLMKVFMTFLEKQFEEHKKTFDPDNLRDILDYMIFTQQQAEEEDSSMKGALQDIHIIMTVFDVFGAGLDTINSFVQSAIAEAMLNPEKQEKMYQELEENLGGARDPTSADRTKLPYTEAFMCEVLRHNTFAVLGVPLSTTCDTTIGGYDLPKDTMVMINFWALHNDDEMWDEPSVFKPQRFLDDSGQLCQRPDSFMPFSAGKRVCLGENLAKTELMILLPMLLQKFKFVAPPNFQLEYEDTGLANLPKPFEAILECRN